MTSSDRQAFEEAQQYVRWTPNNLPYAIELKLQLVPALIAAIDEGEKLETEIGGVLLGSLSDFPGPTLRIQDFELAPRNLADGPVFMLDPVQQQYFSTLQERAKQKGMSAAGFFRSHIRPGPLRPSLADKTLLLDQFKDPAYVVLLVEAREPRLAAFFLSVNHQLSAEPAVQEFRFSERALRSAKEIQPSFSTERRNIGSRAGRALPRRSIARGSRYALIGVLLLIALTAGVISWPVLNGVFSSADRLDVEVVGKAPVLKVSWNHSAREIARATDALLIITDGSSRRTVELGQDELKLGLVEYEPRTQLVRVTLTLNMPGSTSVSQSAEWQPNS